MKNLSRTLQDTETETKDGLLFLKNVRQGSTLLHREKSIIL